MPHYTGAAEAHAEMVRMLVAIQRLMDSRDATIARMSELESVPDGEFGDEYVDLDRSLGTVDDSIANMQRQLWRHCNDAHLDEINAALADERSAAQ